MILFIKGLIIGFGKIIPGVSGALLAINFNIYDKAISSIVNFFDDWRKNLQFLLTLGLGILVSIVLCSKGIMYLLNNYKFLTMMLFIGLISGGTYNFSSNIKYNIKNVAVIFLVIIILFLLTIGNSNNIYILQNNFFDNIVYFIGGIAEVIASIIPGISGTAIQMIIGIYDNVIMMISNIFNPSYVLRYINLYISYGIGIILSFIIGIILIDKLLKKHHDKFNVVVLGLCIYSILMLFIMAFSIKTKAIELVIGIMLLMSGLLIGCILDK